MMLFKKFFLATYTIEINLYIETKVHNLIEIYQKLHRKENVVKKNHGCLNLKRYIFDILCVGEELQKEAEKVNNCNMDT